MMKRRGYSHYLLCVTLLYLILALTWAFLIPPWQGPDEPGHYEYARLLADLHRPPHPRDTDPTLQAFLIRDMDRHDFWRFTRQKRPHPLPTRFADHPFLQRSGTQLRDERPLYYIIPALIFAHMPFAYHLIVARVYTVILGALLVAISGLAAYRAYPHEPLLRDGIPWLVAVLPMPLFIHATVNSNAFADLLGGIFFMLAWTALKSPRPKGSTWLGLLILTLLGIWLKRTTLIFGPIVLLLAWMIPASPLRQQARALRLIILSIILALVLFPRAPERAAHWVQGPRPHPAIRAPGRGVGGSAAFWLADKSHQERVYIAQNLWAQDILVTRGRKATVRVQVRAVDDTPSVCLFLADSYGRSVACTRAGSTWQTLTVTRTVHPETTFVRVVLGIGPPRDPYPVGTILADNFVLHIKGMSRNFLRNGNAEDAAWRFSSLWNRIRGLVHWGPSTVYRPTTKEEHHGVTRAVIALGIVFTSFWGNFGWLQYPLPWILYVLLAIVTLVALSGAMRALRHCREEAARCRLLRFNAGGFLLALVGNWVLSWQPGWYPQGRYLFPLLLPILAVGLEGLRAWLPPSLSETHVLRWLKGIAWGYSLFCLGYYVYMLGG